MMMMMIMIHDDDDDDDDDNVKKQVVFWNHDDTFSHATFAKSSFRCSGMLIFCPYNVHFLHGREKVGNQVVTKFHGHPSSWSNGQNYNNRKRHGKIVQGGPRADRYKWSSRWPL